VSEWTARAVHPEDGRRLEWDGIDSPLEGSSPARTSIRARARRACSARDGTGARAE
jgi:hypothetical protein